MPYSPKELEGSSRQKQAGMANEDLRLGKGGLPVSCHARIRTFLRLRGVILQRDVPDGV